MGTTISFINDKGGVAKSTSTICLATCFKSKGFRVAIVDSDARHTCVDWSALADELEGGDPPLVVAQDGSNVGKQMQRLSEDYDFVICDGMSSFVNAGRRDAIASIIKASDVVLIPTQPNQFDLWAIQQVSGMILERQEITDGSPRAFLHPAL
ncbi:MAG: AAA family ATPase, partial [Puniceicoccales bacterium]